jgi:cysteine desulfurase
VEEKMVKQSHGAGHEFGVRAGTENVIGTVGLGKAMELVEKNLPHWEVGCYCFYFCVNLSIFVPTLFNVQEHMREQRNRLWNELNRRHGSSVRLNGPADINDRRLPNTLTFCVRGLNAALIVSECAGTLVCVSLIRFKLIWAFIDLFSLLFDVIINFSIHSHCQAISAGAACHSCETENLSPIMQDMHVPEDFVNGMIRLSTGVSTSEDDITDAIQILSNVIVKLSQTSAIVE